MTSVPMQDEEVGENSDMEERHDDSDPDKSPTCPHYNTNE